MNFYTNMASLGYIVDSENQTKPRPDDYWHDRKYICSGV